MFPPTTLITAVAVRLDLRNRFPLVFNVPPAGTERVPNSCKVLPRVAVPEIVRFFKLFATGEKLTVPAVPPTTIEEVAVLIRYPVPDIPPLMVSVLPLRDNWPSRVTSFTVKLEASMG